MLSYHLHEAVRNLRKAPSTALLTIFVLGIGLGSSILMAGLSHILSGDPLAGRGEEVFQVHTGIEVLEPYQMRYSDAKEVARLAPGPSVLVGSRGFTSLRNAQSGDDLGQTPIRAVNSEFFAGFDAQFRAGSAWLKSDDQAGSPVAVISNSLATEIFGSGANAIGKTVMLGGAGYTVAGVLSEAWSPAPKFFDMESGFFSKPEDALIPLSSLSRIGDPEKTFITFTCPSGIAFPNAADLPSSDCLWVSAWYRLPTQSARDVALSRIQRFQQDSSRRIFSAPSLDSAMSIIKKANVVPEAVTVYTHLSFVFLCLCLMSTSGLLLARYLRRTKEIGIRRALGATGGAIALHLVTESTVLTILAGAFGLVVCLVGALLAQYMPFEYARLVHFNFYTLILLVALSLGSGALCAAFPALIATKRAPAALVRSGS